MKRLALITLLLAGCTAEIPAGRLACDTAADCPPEWVCEGTPGRCQPDPSETSDAGPNDAGVMDAGSDAGPGPDTGPPANGCGGTVPLAGEPGESCGACGTGEWRCDPLDADAVICHEDFWGQVASGERHACAIRGDGSLWCWGSQDDGRLGNGEPSGQAPTPQPVDSTSSPPLECWVAVTAGRSHTCAIDSAGRAWCWGNGDDGRLGDDDGVESQSRPAAVRNSEDSGVWSDWVELSAGASHTCGRRRNNRIYCWGRGDDGQLGHARGSESRLPVEVTTDGGAAGTAGWADWSMVVAGQAHTCGIRGGGSAWCWGSRADGRLGDGGDTDSRVTPSRVLSPSDSGEPWSDWQTIGVGDAHSCGLRGDGSTWCWGLGNQGRLGNGAETSSSGPVLVVVSSGGAWNGVSLSVGYEHGCGLRPEDGALQPYCWGSDLNGRLGTGSPPGNESTPTLVAAPEDEPGAFDGTSWLSVHGVGNRSFGRRSDGSLWAWGDGTDGARGDSSTVPERSTPVRVLDP